MNEAWSGPLSEPHKVLLSALCKVVASAYLGYCVGTKIFGGFWPPLYTAAYTMFAISLLLLILYRRNSAPTGVSAFFLFLTTSLFMAPTFGALVQWYIWSARPAVILVADFEMPARMESYGFMQSLRSSVRRLSSDSLLPVRPYGVIPANISEAGLEAIAKSENARAIEWGFFTRTNDAVRIDFHWRLFRNGTPASADHFAAYDDTFLSSRRPFENFSATFTGPQITLTQSLVFAVSALQAHSDRRYEDAANLYSKAISKLDARNNISTVLALDMARGYAYIASNHFDKAYLAFTDAINLAPRYSDVPYLARAGSSLVKCYEFDALQDYKTALTIKRSPEALVGMARIHQQYDYGLSQNEMLEARRIANDRSNVMPLDETPGELVREVVRSASDKFALEAFSRTAAALYFDDKLHHYESAREEFQLAIRADPENANVWENYAGTELAHGNFSTALNAFREAVRLEPKYALARNGICATYLAFGDARAAIESCTESIRSLAANPQAFLLRSEAEKRLGLMSAAAGDVKRARFFSSHQPRCAEPLNTRLFVASD